jgi:YHS domain-containing protein
MHVEEAEAPASAVQAGERFYFSWDRCRLRFEADPERFTAKKGKPVEVVESESVPVAFGRVVKKEEGKEQ